MAHGQPDYGVTAGAVTTYQVADLGELAARLGSPITYDRRGDVVWWDDFECGLAKWATVAVGANASTALSSARARNGRQSCRLRPGDAINNAASITHSHHVPALSGIGLEFAASFGEGNHQLDMQLTIQAEAARHRAWVRILNNGTFQYHDAASVYQTFYTTPTTLNTSATHFHTFKLVYDAERGEFRRFRWNEREFDLSGIAPQITIPGIPSFQTLIEIIDTTLAVTPSGTWIDDVILTQNEPV